MSARTIDGIGWLLVSGGLLLMFFVVVRINAPKSIGTRRVRAAVAPFWRTPVNIWREIKCQWRGGHRWTR